MKRTIKDFQREVGEWSRALFGDNDHNFSKITGLPRGSEDARDGLVEEVGELHRVSICSHQGRRGYDDPKKARADKVDSVADIMVFLLDYCERENIDLEQALTDTWDKVVCKRNLENWSDVSHDTVSEITSVDPAAPGTEVTVEMLCGPASEGIIHPGTDYEFCWESEAEEWYDFHVNTWKKMNMAGYIHPCCKLFRRPVKSTQPAAADDGVCYETHPETD